jgi:hypothetical protein
VVQVVPIASGKGDVFGFMAGEFKIVGDIESPVAGTLGRIRRMIPIERKGKLQT